MRKLFKNLTAIGLSVTMVVGTASMASAAVAKGTDVSNGKAWTSYSIHTREDNGSWEDKLIGAGQKYQNKENTYKSYGEDAKITTQTSSSFTMNVVSTGWSANWTPMGTVGQSNPWGVTADKVVNVERGRYYTISFKIKSTLKNEIMKSQDKKDANGNVVKDSEGKAMGENVGTGKYNYVKGNNRVSPMFIPMGIANMPAGNVAIDLGLKGESISIVTACASSTHAIGEAFRNIQDGLPDSLKQNTRSDRIGRRFICSFPTHTATRE